MFYHYHTPHRDPPKDARLAPRRVVQSVCCQQYCQWRIEVTSRAVGITIRRQQFRAAVRHEPSGLLHVLDGYPSAESACQAARQWIDGQVIRRRVAARQRRLARARAETPRTDQVQ